MVILFSVNFVSGNTVATDMLSEHPLLSEPSSVSFYNWMSNAVGNRGSVVQESPVTKSGHNSLPTGITIVVFILTVLSGTHSFSKILFLRGWLNCQMFK